MNSNSDSSGSISIGSQSIGPEQPVFIIAEAGVNHNGNSDLAHQLVDAAAQAGADAVKFQLFDADLLVTSDAPKAEYQTENSGEGSQQEMLRALQLPLEVFSELKQHAEEIGLAFLCTPFDLQSAKFLDGLDIGAFKVSSGDLTNLPFLRQLASFGCPLLLSTGMADMAEVHAAQEIVAGTPHAFLHCTSEYPAPIGHLNLRVIETMQQALGVPIGYSDHSEEIATGGMAVAAGACFLERHITSDQTLPGPDHKASLEPGPFGDYVRAVRQVESALGSAIKEPGEAERKVAAVVRKSIHAAVDLEVGAVLAEEHLCIQRPEGGAPPSDFPKLVGKSLKIAIPKGGPVRFDLVKDAGFTGEDS